VPALDATADEVALSPAARLFADRAAAVRPGFEITVGNAATIGEICRRLDGLPLAIELAASRLRALPLAQIAARLDERLALLTRGSRTVLPRHRTLRATIAWSWDLLDEDERDLAERLAVFPATITPDSAARVDGLTQNGLDALASLVDKSLLQVVDSPEPRYRMLETVREYGLERLDEAGRLSEARAAHMRCFLDLSERAEPQLRSAGQVRWMRVLTTERDNLLAASRFAFDSGDSVTAVRMCAALALFWMIRGEQADAVGMLGRALRSPSDAAPGDDGGRLRRLSVRHRLVR
jgi:predicted ATPase